MFRLTPTVKNLLIINVVVFVATFLFQRFNLSAILAMYRLDSQFFAPYQLLTYMFAHANFMHILFNMLMLAFLGPSLEMVWGGKKFLVFYLVAGIGAGIFYGGIGYFDSRGFRSDLRSYAVTPTPEGLSKLVAEHEQKFRNGYQISSIYDFITKFEQNPDRMKDESVRWVQEAEVRLIDQNPGRVIGASGAVYGILMAFGLLFPERQLMLLFPPIPVKAKYLVLVLGGLAIYMGLSRNAGDQVAHFAHLGGMVFAFIMVKFF